MLRIYPGKNEALNKDALLSLLPSGVITLTRNYLIRYANAAAESFLGESMTVLGGREITHFIFPATRLLELVDAAFASKSLLKEYNTTLSGPRVGLRTVNLQVLPLDDGHEALIVIDDRGISQHMPPRESARFTSGMASILAHEVKNPLSGIRGAAQLLQKTVSPDDQKLTSLIVSEVDRIKGVIEEMEIFSNPSELRTESINIHEVLQYVRLLAEQGFAKHVKFKEIYDPSIPDVAGHRNLLIQLFLNLIKNAAEALGQYNSPSIKLTTQYQSGFRFKAPGMQESRSLPVVVCVEDNGAGIPEELRESIFDPFVTTKEGGKGLGLAIVAKIVADHGGAIVLEEGVREGTRFRIFLPAA
jgi:two-component system nitrogen regulation sensor histidine kinase GlnL